MGEEGIPEPPDQTAIPSSAPSEVSPEVSAFMSRVGAETLSFFSGLGRPDPVTMTDVATARASFVRQLRALADHVEQMEG